MNVATRRTGFILAIVIATTLIAACKKNSQPAVFATPTNNAVVTPPTPFNPFSTINPLGGMPGTVISLPINGVLPANATLAINGIPVTIALFQSGSVTFTVPANATTGNLTLTANGVIATYPAIFTVPTATFSISSSSFAPANISFDTGGNLYGTIGDTVIKITSTGVVSKLAVIGTGSTLTGGCVADAGGNVYVSTLWEFSPTTGRQYNAAADYKIYKITPTGAVNVFAGNASATIVDGQGTSASFLSPSNLAIDAKGNIYVADELLIRKITPQGLVTTIAGNTNSITTFISLALDGQGTASSFVSLNGITVDNAGNIYVSDGTNGRICKVTPTGLVTSIPPTNSGQADFLDLGIGVDGEMPSTKMAVDPNGNLFIAVNTALYMVSNAGIRSNTFLNPTNYTIDGMAFDVANNIYLSCTGYHSDPNTGLSLPPFRDFVKVVH